MLGADEPEDDTPLSFANATLLVEDVSDDIVQVKLKVSDNLERSVGKAYHDGNNPTPNVLLHLNYKLGICRIFLQVYFYREDLYDKKYAKIREIQIPFDDSDDRIEDGDAAHEFLSNLPSGFIKDPSYGLGFVREMRPIIEAIEQLDGVTRIEISPDEPTSFTLDTFYLNTSDFDALRTGINSITRHHQKISLADRRMLARNETLHRVAPAKYPYEERPYEPGMIFKLLGGNSGSGTVLKGKDRKALLSSVAKNAASIAARDPKEFVQLQKDIELVSLDRLIAAFEVRLRRNSRESEWQKLLEINPFILSMLFGHPIVTLASGASLGGQTVGGDGTKIADFLASNPLTRNAALVELKRPKTALFGKEYRKNVFSPSQELVGSMVQVLDQRLKLTQNVKSLAYDNEELKGMNVFYVDCVIVAGRNPTDKHKIASFELIRNQMKDVRIITYDELLERMKLLRELLSGERYVSEYDETDDAFNADRDLVEADMPDEEEDGHDYDGPSDEDRDPSD